MSQIEESQDEIIDQPVEPGQDVDPKKPGAMSGVLGWVISGVLHGLLIVLAGTVYFLVKEEVIETPPVRVQQIEAPPKKDEKPKEKREITPTVEVNVAAESDKPSPISDLQVHDEKTATEDDNDAEQPKGREEAVATSETGGSGAFMAIGAGGGSAGMFGSRSGGGRKRAVGKMGGSKGSESAVEAALRWLKKHQSPNGMWDNVNYNKQCTEDPKCEPGPADGKHGPDQVDPAMTGYALLCFLGAGYDHVSPNKYRDTVKRGISYLMSIQKPDGLIGVRNYEHPIAVMALAEAFAMTGAADLKAPTQKGVDIILARQNRDPKADAAYAGLGWNYERSSARNDASVTGWNVMALKSAYAAGIDVKDGMDGAKNWLLQHWRASNADKGPGWEDKLDHYKDETSFGYIWNTGDKDNEGKWEGKKLASVGLVCAVFLGHRAGDVMLETMANFVMNRQTPKTWPCNTYYLYYNTLGMFQVGGDKWKTWNSVVRDMLVEAQRKDAGCFNGSWDFAKAGPPSEYGRILSTVYCCLSLEVYYRYAQVAQAGIAGKGH